MYPLWSPHVPCWPTGSHSSPRVLDDASTIKGSATIMVTSLLANVHVTIQCTTLSLYRTMMIMQWKMRISSLMMKQRPYRFHLLMHDVHISKEITTFNTFRMLTYSRSNGAPMIGAGPQDPIQFQGYWMVFMHRDRQTQVSQVLKKILLWFHSHAVYKSLLVSCTLR